MSKVSAVNIELLDRVSAPADAPSIDDSFVSAGRFGGRIEDVEEAEKVGRDYSSHQPTYKIRYWPTAKTSALEPGVQRLRFLGAEWEIQRIDAESRPGMIWAERIMAV